VQVRTVCWALLAAGSVACAAAKPHTFGNYNDLTPKVTPKTGERTPQHITIDVARPSNVAVFLVVPGRGSQLLFPADSTQSGFVQAGAHEVETSIVRLALTDSARLIRRPNQGSINPNDPRQQQRSRNGGFDPSNNPLLNRGYLLIYATQDSLPYSVLSTRVSGVTIPIEDDDALNTVTKLIRETTHTTGTWAAYATEFSP
jgi:hypothetical protein